MDQNELKRRAAQAAIAYVPKGTIVGVGTGSTVNHFIAELGAIKSEIQAAVASSEATARLLEQAGIRVVDLNEVDSLSVYVDGADEISPQLHMIKGGGGALTREKIVAAVARRFVCICDESKFVPVLGKFPLPVEVIPMARNYVARELTKLGGKPVPRAGVITDNGNVILDVREFEIRDPVQTESAINQIPGVVTCGIFARRRADVLLLATPQGVVTHSA